MMTAASWFAAAVAVAGNVLVICKSRWGYALWLVSNGFFVWYNWTIGAFAQAVLFVVYTGLSLWGFMHWRNHGDDSR